MIKFKSVTVMLVLSVVCALIVFTFAACMPEKPQETKSVARVVVLAGQSNCEGVARNDALKSKVDAETYKAYENGFSNVLFVRPSSGIHIDNFVPCKIGFGTSYDHFGIELGMAEYLSVNFPEDTFYLVKKAHGGTSIDYWWGDIKPWDSPENYFAGLVKDVKNAITVLEKEGKNVIVEALCWMQGESDSDTQESANCYGEKLKAMVESFRSEFSTYNGSAIKFVDGGINDESTMLPYFSVVNSKKQEFAQSCESNFYIDTIAMGLTKHNDPTSDLLHYDSLSMLRLGNEFAKYITL